MKAYYGHWSVNHGQSYNREAYTYTNLREAIKSIKACAEGNCPVGSFASWSIYESIGDDEPVRCGVIRK